MDDHEATVRAALEVPLAAALGCRLLDEDDPARGAWLEVDELALNGVGGVHASALDVLCELAGFLAVLPALSAHEHAVTHARAVQLLGTARAGQRVQARGELRRRTGRLAFVAVTATVGEDLVAAAELTKSVVRPR